MPSAPEGSADKPREAVKRGQPLRSAVDLLEHLLRAQADVLVESVRGVTERADLIEEPAALFRLLQHPPGWMADLDVQKLRRSCEEFSVVLRDT